MQLLAHVEPLPTSCISTSALPSNLEELAKGECMLQTLNEFSVMQFDDSTITYRSSPEDQLQVAAMGYCAMCANDCSPDEGFGPHRHDLYVETDNISNMECSFAATWENWLEATSPSTMECIDILEKRLEAMSQSQAPQNDGFEQCAHGRYAETDNANMKCSLDIWEDWSEPTNPSNMAECSDIWEELLEATSHSQGPDNGMSSSANILSACFSSNISMSSLPNTNDTACSACNPNILPASFSSSVFMPPSSLPNTNELSSACKPNILPASDIPMHSLLNTSAILSSACRPNLLPGCFSSNISMPSLHNTNVMSSSACKRNILPACFSSSTSMLFLPNTNDMSSLACKPDILPASNICMNSLPNTNDMFSLASRPNILPACSSSNISMPSLPNTNSLFIEPSLGYSTPYQHDSHPPNYMNNHVYNHLDISIGIHDNATNSMDVSFSPVIAHRNAPIMYTGSAATGDDCFDDEASLIFAGCGPSHEPYPPSLAVRARAIRSQLLLEVRSSPPLHQNFRAADHYMNETRAINNSDNCEAGEIVSILVEAGSIPTIEDGYKWLKYGQKNIKDKMHPRCYFKCSERNCPVKKQIEGSSDKPGYVLITYIGKHNHSQAS